MKSLRLAALSAAWIPLVSCAELERRIDAADSESATRQAELRTELDTLQTTLDARDGEIAAEVATLRERLVAVEQLAGIAANDVGVVAAKLALVKPDSAIPSKWEVELAIDSAAAASWAKIYGPLLTWVRSDNTAKVAFDGPMEQFFATADVAAERLDTLAEWENGALDHDSVALLHEFRSAWTIDPVEFHNDEPESNSTRCLLMPVGIKIRPGATAVAFRPRYGSSDLPFWVHADLALASTADFDLLDLLGTRPFEFNLSLRCEQVENRSRRPTLAIDLCFEANTMIIDGQVGFEGHLYERDQASIGAERQSLGALRLVPAY